MAALVWWRGHGDDLFYIVGMGGRWSAVLGHAFPAVCAGLTISLSLLMVDTVAGPWAGVVAAICVAALPGMAPLHRTSLLGPPLAALSLMMLAVMLHAPRFSLAYGAIAAIGAVFVSPAGVGLPAAAVGWALAQGRGVARMIRRALFALVPLAVVIGVAQWVGDEWPEGGVVTWRGGLDRGLQATGSIIGDQLTPGIVNPALRFFAIADLTLILFALVMLAWRRVRHLEADAPPRRLFQAAGVLALAYAVGLTVRTLFIAETPEPDLAAVFPLVLVSTVVIVTSIAIFWPRWNRWGRLAAGVLLAGWLQAAIRLG